MQFVLHFRLLCGRQKDNTNHQYNIYKIHLTETKIVETQPPAIYQFYYHYLTSFNFNKILNLFFNFIDINRNKYFTVKANRNT